MKYQISKAPEFLYRNGIRTIGAGVVKKDGKALFDFYKVSQPLSEEQKETLLKFCPDVQFKVSTSQYARELKGAAVLFPKAAWYKARKLEQESKI